MDRVGAYSWWPRTDRWTWNDAMFGLLGHPPDEVRPSRPLLVGHVHPDDRARVEHVLADAAAHRLAYTTRHRLITVSGWIREAVALGRPVDGEGGELALRGYLVPVGDVSGAAVTEPFTGPLTTNEPWIGARVEHDRHLARAVDVLSRTLELPRDGADLLLAHLANAHAAPPILVAERVVAASLDPDHEGIAGLLAGVDPLD